MSTGYKNLAKRVSKLEKEKVMRASSLVGISKIVLWLVRCCLTGSRGLSACACMSVRV